MAQAYNCKQLQHDLMEASTAKERNEIYKRYALVHGALSNATPEFWESMRKKGWE